MPGRPREMRAMLACPPLPLPRRTTTTTNRARPRARRGEPALRRANEVSDEGAARAAPSKSLERSAERDSGKARRDRGIDVRLAQRARARARARAASAPRRDEVPDQA